MSRLVPAVPPVRLRSSLSFLTVASVFFRILVLASEHSLPVRAALWNDPLNWHTRDGHTLQERKREWREETIFPEVSAHGRGAHEDLCERR